MTTTWHSTDAPVTGPLADLIRAGIWDINKMVHYFPVYESAFGDPTRPVKILEIGVSFGGSLELWRQYFTHRDSVIVGIDANPNCFQFDDPERDIHVRIGKQQDEQFLRSVVEEFGPFDIILDDGSHIPAFTLASFRFLFLHGLADGGAYLVEDLHTCYSSDCREPFPDQPWLYGANDGSPQFTDYVKQLIDVMHEVYLQTDTGDGVDKLEPGNPSYKTSFNVSEMVNLIKSIEMHDSIVVIRRGPRELARMLRRWSRERMSTVLSETAAEFLDDNPHLGNADTARKDWFT